MRSAKILIIGNGGTGKSTLADKLGKEFHILFVINFKIKYWTISKTSRSMKDNSFKFH